MLVQMALDSLPALEKISQKQQRRLPAAATPRRKLLIIKPGEKRGRGVVTATATEQAKHAHESPPLLLLI